MSDTTLTPSAPGDPAAATAPEPVAPAVVPEVVVGSAGSPDLSGYIEKARFDGLMATLNREKEEATRRQAAWEATQRQYESELANLRNPTQGDNTVADDAILAELQALRAENAAVRLDAARRTVVEEFPEAAAFADILQGSTPDELRASAQAVAERIRGIASPVVTPTDPPAAGEPPAPTAPVPTSAPVVGGMVPVTGDVSADDRVAAAIAKANTPSNMGVDRTAAWKDYLAAKSSQARDEYQRMMAAEQAGQ